MTMTYDDSGSQVTGTLQELLDASQCATGEERARLCTGLYALLTHVVASSSQRVFSVQLLDMLLAEIDARLSEQVNEILHNEQFLQLESAWRGLKTLVDQVRGTHNIYVEYINVSKEDLLDDFEDAPLVTGSGLYRHVYTAEYGQFGGKPIGAMIGNYDFTPKPQDLRLLQYISSVSAMAHTPFIAAAGKAFFGIDSWDALPNLKDLRSIFEMPHYAAWHAFRASGDARYALLTLPRYLLRMPYDPDNAPARSFQFTEDTSVSDRLCWGNTAFVFAGRLVESFARYGWCVNIIGPDGGGAVNHLATYHFASMGQIQSKIPTQVLISEKREFELAEEGFVALAMRKGADNAVFFSANTCQSPKSYAGSAGGQQTTLDFKLSTQLPYMMIMNRLAHYIKVIQRENIGKWKERGDLERELNKWLAQYVTEMDNPDAESRNKRPLRMAKIIVSDVPNDPGWYGVTILARPHFKYMGANFTLSLMGKLDKR